MTPEEQMADVIVAIIKAALAPIEKRLADLEAKVR